MLPSNTMQHNSQLNRQDQLLHLQFIQDVINRMACNSFLFKGWTVTLISGIFLVASIKELNFLLMIPVLPTIAFWDWILITLGRKNYFGNCMKKRDYHIYQIGKVLIHFQ